MRRTSKVRRTLFVVKVKGMVHHWLTLCVTHRIPDAARLKSASLGALRRASAYADALVGAGRPLAAG
ncbi:MAG TPA: hypothetical protein ENF52_04945, partial [Chloroflexi bacterium]|nr:hypothetical protein [Chloroflexota bacterium]